MRNAEKRAALREGLFSPCTGCQHYGCVEAPTFCLFCQFMCINAILCSLWGGYFGGLLRTSLVSELFYLMMGSVKSIYLLSKALTRASLAAPDGLRSATLGLFGTLRAVAEHFLLCGAAGRLCVGSRAALRHLLCLSPAPAAGPSTKGSHRGGGYEPLCFLPTLLQHPRQLICPVSLRILLLLYSNSNNMIFSQRFLNCTATFKWDNNFKKN